MAKMGKQNDALPLAEESYRLATDHGLTALAQQIIPILDFVRSEIGQVQTKEDKNVSVSIPTLHPAADPECAARLNIQYHEELRRWKALPLWKRLRTKKPEPPKGI